MFQTCVLTVCLCFSSVLPEQRPSLPHSFTSTLGSICGPVGSAESEDGAAAGAQPLPAALCHSGFHSSPSSCYSDWDSSLWNTWSSAMDSNRTSLISSVDSCYTNDSATFARLLAAAAETMSAASLTGRRGTGGSYMAAVSGALYTHTHIHTLMYIRCITVHGFSVYSVSLNQQQTTNL